MSDCGSCSACSIDDKAKEYINYSGMSAVKCPGCGKEITFSKLPPDNRLICPDCGTDIKIIRLLLN